MGGQHGHAVAGRGDVYAAPRKGALARLGEGLRRLGRDEVAQATPERSRGEVLGQLNRSIDET